MELFMLRFQTVFLAVLFNIFTLCFAEDNAIVSILNTSLSANPAMCVEDMRCKNANTLKEFYKKNNYTLKWFKDGKLTSSAQNLIATLNTAYTDGLNPKNYHTKQINSLIKVLDSDEENSNKVTVSLELTLSDAFLIYSNDLYYGMLNVKKVYPDWIIVKKPIDNIKELESATSDSELTIKDLTPIYPGYAKLKDKLQDYQEIYASGGFIKVPESGTMELGDKGDNVKALRNRLFMSGELNTEGGNKFDDELQKAVMQFQLNNGLFDDGVVESDTLVELNVSAKSRIRQIELNMDKMRLLPMDLKADYVLVNLPGYYLKVVHDGKDVLTMDIAVGGSEHPSCVLNSKIDHLVLNPYWNIPAQIAESEIWTSILKNPNYLNDKHVQVLKKQNGEYKVIDPKGFNWSKMTRKEFNSYRYRQSPGEQNALGKVKFYFPNNCGIYLHDSNERDLFDIYQRDFSHGCIRVSQPLNLSTYVLNSQKQWSAHKVNDMFQNDINKTVQLVKPFNVYITYLTSFVSDDDFIQFRHDIYGFDKKANMANYSGFMPKKVAIETEMVDNN
jgi:murein L,D-transpeptidase YcbB/YkuD